MIFEWRSYRFAPGVAQDYLALFQSEGLQLVTRHLPLLGYWLTESGRLNMLHHLWVYADLADRSRRRATLSADVDWVEEFGPRAFPMIQSQDTMLLELVASFPAFDAATIKAPGQRQPLPADAPVLGAGWATFTLSDGPDDHDILLPGDPTVWRIVSGARPGATVRLARFSTAADIPVVLHPCLRHEIVRPTAFSPLQ